MATKLEHPDQFIQRHLGPRDHHVAEMAKVAGFASLDALIDATVPASIRLKRPLNLPKPRTEQELLAYAREVAAQNQMYRSYIGTGYHDCITPGVIQRNVLENPGWYTAYTPYQAEIAQGRLEALLNFQTVIMDLTGMEIANASLLDEGTAAAEAMTMLFNVHAKTGGTESHAFFVSHECHPQTIDVVRTRAAPLGIDVIVGDHQSLDFGARKVFGALMQYPSTDGVVHDYAEFCARAHAAGALLVFDEITIGFRLTLGGAHLRLGVEPDIAVFAKSLGNGHPIGAVIGTREAMQGAHRTFISSTYWTEGVGPAAALATLRKMQQIDVPAHCRWAGEQVKSAWRSSAQRHALAIVDNNGYPALAHFAFDHPEAQLLKTAYIQRMLRRGFLAGTVFYATLAHTPEVLESYAQAIDEVFAEMAAAIATGQTAALLDGPVAQVGFTRLL